MKRGLLPVAFASVCLIAAIVMAPVSSSYHTEHWYVFVIAAVILEFVVMVMENQ